MQTYLRTIIVAALGIASVPAFAASDYLLQLDDVKGEKSTIEVQSWSWGTSNPTSVGSSGMSAGKVSVQDLSVMKAPQAGQDFTAVITARDAGSGMATGRRMAACTSGTHFPSAVLTMRGTRYELSDVTLGCPSGAERKRELTGHVTLIK